MKQITIIFILFLSGCAHYQHDPWTQKDIVNHAALTTLMVIDWRQTKALVKDLRFYECNPYLGKHPSQNKIDLYFATSFVGKTVGAYLLPKDWRERWQWFFVGVSAGCVVNNYSIGVRIDL